MEIPSIPEIIKSFWGTNIIVWNTPACTPQWSNWHKPSFLPTT